MKTITRFQIKGTTFAIVELDGGGAGKTHTFGAVAYPRWTGEHARDLTQQPMPTRAIAQPGAYVETPIAQQTIESNVKVPFYTALISGGFAGALTLCGWQFLHLPQPLTALVASTLISTWWGWRGSLGFGRSLLHKIEDFTGIDWNRDNQVGSGETRNVMSPFPVRVAGDNKPAPSTAAEPAPAAWVGKTNASTPIAIRSASKNRTARVVTLGDVWEFLKVSHSTGDWTKATWTQARGMSQPMWKDYQDFLEPFGFWKFTGDTPLLKTALRRFCAPDTYLSD